MREVVTALSEATKLWTIEEILRNPSPIKHRAGMYGWYFRGLPDVPASEAMVDGFSLLYVGIAPVSAESSSTLSERIRRRHVRGKASTSTLRFTLGCLLADYLGLTLQQKGTKYHFGEQETVLTQWLSDNARVVWCPHARPWEIERDVIAELRVPLNIKHNENHEYYSALRQLRDQCRTRARSRADA